MNLLLTKKYLNILIFLFAIIGFTANSCKKDSTYVSKITTSVKKLTVADAKSWYYNHLPKKSANSIDLLFSDFTTFWNYASERADTNYYIVETPITYENSLGFSIGDTIQVQDTSAIHTLTRLLTLKDKQDSSMSSALMHINGNSTADVNAVHYNNIPANFSGEIFYTDVYGNYVNGVTYINGSITHTSHPEITPLSVKKRNDGLKVHLNAGCTITPVDVYSRTCTDIVYPDGVVYNAGCSSWHYENTILVEKCTETGSGGSSGGYSHGGSGGTGAPAQNNSDPCAKGKKIATSTLTKEKLADLASKLNLPSEYAYLLKETSTSSTATLVEGGPGGVNFPFAASSFNGSTGAIHNHENNNGNLSIFSPDDFKTFYNIITQSNITDPSSYTFCVVTSSGTYALVINDLDKFKNTGAQYLTPDKYPIFNMYYNLRVSQANTAQQNEVGLVSLLNSVNSGLTILKSNSDFTDWDKIEINMTNGTITYIKCN